MCAFVDLRAFGEARTLHLAGTDRVRTGKRRLGPRRSVEPLERVVNQIRRGECRMASASQARSGGKGASRADRPGVRAVVLFVRRAGMLAPDAGKRGCRPLAAS